MKVLDIVHAFAGSLVVIGVLLTVFVNTMWMVLPIFVGLNLFQFGFSGFCPLSLILKRLGFREK
ncbi:MAG: DUF2892 domain-containing protein [SAR324 cluster bacterium]|nr:DUF2892 domain-containing protein [SAR324 cluster bacterium]